MSLMPFIRLSISKRRALLAASISFNGEIISPCSHYMKKGLVCITIANPFGCQPSFYIECTKLNTYALCNMRSVSLNEYAFLCTRCCTY